MRAFILVCLVATACAQYNYQPNESGSALLSGSNGGGSSAGSLGGGGGVGDGQPAAPVEYSKQFYSFSAPESEFNDASQNVANSLKKNLRVIFIKGPENQGLENAALQLAAAAGEEKTAIYVLQKQADVGSLAQKLQAIRSQGSNRPDVHFVKYRTQQDAQNAQQAIQSQYNQLPGQSQSHNGGNAPVLNFASPATQVHAPAPQSPSTAYLPSSILKLFRRK